MTAAAGTGLGLHLLPQLLPLLRVACLPPPPDSLQSSVHSQLSQWKSLADDRESRLAQQAAAVHQLESELRQQHTKHEAALAELHLKHEQVGGLAS